VNVFVIPSFPSSSTSTMVLSCSVWYVLFLLEYVSDCASHNEKCVENQPIRSHRVAGEWRRLAVKRLNNVYISSDFIRG